MKTWTRSEGNIRLSEDDGPPSTEFLDDDDDDDDDGLEWDNGDDEPLSDRTQKPRKPAMPGLGSSSDSQNIRQQQQHQHQEQ